MAKIIVSFWEKNPRSSKIQDAINIAEKCNHYLIDERCYVEFEKLDNNFYKIMEVVGNWASTRFYIDNIEISPEQFKNIFLCFAKELCEGVCFNQKRYEIAINEKETNFWDINLNHFLNRINADNKIGYIDVYDKNEKIPFLEKIDNLKFKINKKELISFFKREWHFEIKYCPIINIKKTLNIIDKIPQIIEIRDMQYYEKKREKERLEEQIELEHYRDSAIMRIYGLSYLFEKILLRKKIKGLKVKTITNKQKSVNLIFFKNDGKKSKRDFLNNDIIGKLKKEIDEFPTEDVYNGGYIGFINQKMEVIQFIREDNNTWIINLLSPDIPYLKKIEGIYNHHDSLLVQLMKQKKVKTKKDSPRNITLSVNIPQQPLNDLLESTKIAKRIQYLMDLKLTTNEVKSITKDFCQGKLLKEIFNQ